MFRIEELPQAQADAIHAQELPIVLKLIQNALKALSPETKI